MTDSFRRDCIAVLEQHFLCVLATISEVTKPEAAIVGFSHSEDLELLIGTSNASRKYANLQQNPHVAVAIGDTKAEVQLEGTIRELAPDELEAKLAGHFTKMPGTKRYLEDPTQRWLLITPTWIRLTVHGDEQRIEEVTIS